MNRFYGVRILRAFASETAWYDINECGGKVMTVAGILIFLLGVAAMLWPPRTVTWVLLVGIAPAPIVLLTLIPILRHARRLDAGGAHD